MPAISSTRGQAICRVALRSRDGGGEFGLAASSGPGVRRPQGPPSMLMAPSQHGLGAIVQSRGDCS